MRISRIKSISPDEGQLQLPLNLTQKSSNSALVADGIFLAIAALAFALPAGLFAAEAVAAPEITQITMTSQPVPTIMTVAGLLMLLVPVIFLLQRLLTGVGSRRSVHITEQIVHVIDKTLAGPIGWKEELKAFKGITHHVRTTLSLPRHELILVHPDPRRSVLLKIASSISMDEMDEVSKFMRQPILPASCLYNIPFFAKAD